jgi:formamidopyrimidine-DNA glycosylase
MPELPEVEVVRKDLERDAVGKKIKDVQVKLTRIIRRHRNVKEFRDGLVGRKISKVDRRGKYILVHLDSGDVLVMHLGMSGRIERATGRKAPEKHTHVIIKFQVGGELRFVDMRQFGELFVTTKDGLSGVKELAHIAIDPLEDSFTWQHFSELIGARGVKLKALLMDQKFISGLGNIYSDEVLFAAGLRHDRMSDSLSSQEVRRLYRSLQEVLQEAIRFRGTTLGDEAYVDLYGKPGEYQNELKVYGRRGEPCRRCRTPIQVVKYSGRNSYYCPQCQS